MQADITPNMSVYLLLTTASVTKSKTRGDYYFYFQRDTSRLQYLITMISINKPALVVF